MSDVVCITGLVGCIVLYFLGRILYPDPSMVYASFQSQEGEE